VRCLCSLCNDFSSDTKIGDIWRMPCIASKGDLLITTIPASQFFVTCHIFCSTCYHGQSSKKNELGVFDWPYIYKYISDTKICDIWRMLCIASKGDSLITTIPASQFFVTCHIFCSTCYHGQSSQKNELGVFD
jgi:hypothetical protein